LDQGTRDEVLGRLAEAVGSVTVAHPTRVAIDGPPAAGKTTLADELAVVLRDQGRDVIRATIDDFLFPRARRYRARRVLGRRLLLRHPRLRRAEPGSARSARSGRRSTLPTRGLRPHRGYCAVPAGHDRRRDAVLVFDGVFLMRPELIDRWDLRIFVSTRSRRPWIVP
jgi:uridine kinase